MRWPNTVVSPTPVQPSYAASLQQVQKELGAALSERFGNTLRLTDAGRSLEQYAWRILDLVEEAEAAVHVQQDGRGSRIRTGASTTHWIYLLSPLLSSFCKTHYPDTPVLTVEPDHPWAKRKTIRPKELPTQPILGRDRSPPTLETYERAAEAGLGIAFMSASTVAREVQDRCITTLGP